MTRLKAPFPWFGGKSRAASLIWRGLGDVPNYVEPFCGSLAVLLNRPSLPRVETVNDLDCFLSNFWRAVKLDPAAVAHYADWPVNEADLHARHRWLVDQDKFRLRIRREPDFFDPKIAGWWVWGLSQWIGSGWCTNPDWEGRTNAGRDARGIHRRQRSLASSSEWEKRPRLDGAGGVHCTEKLPNVSAGFGKGTGVHRRKRGSEWAQKPDTSGSRGATGRGVHASGREASLLEWFEALANRLRSVRVCCGDWRRVLGPSVTSLIGVTGIVLDPPYGAAAGRDPSLYAEESLTVAVDVREWAIANGADPKLRIALCGYDGEHEMPSDWECVAWRAPGGYAAAVGNTENAKRERVWFSPSCSRAREQCDLFEEVSQ